MANRPSMMCIYDAEWLNMRVNLLGDWTHETFLGNLAVCHGYVDEGRGNVYSRTYRVINCLNSVSMAWNGNGKIETAAKSMVNAARTAIRVRHSTAEQHGERFVWEWDYFNLPTVDLVPIHNVFLGRWKANPDVKWRPELFLALKAMEGVLLTRHIEIEVARS